jgi:hypothetical protein
MMRYIWADLNLSTPHSPIDVAEEWRVAVVGVSSGWYDLSVVLSFTDSERSPKCRIF